jgi:hypothetical protein
MIYNSVIFIGMAVGMAVNAKPLDISPRADDGGFSPVALCLQKNGFPLYPDGDSPSYAALTKCSLRTLHSVKRGDNIIDVREPLNDVPISELNGIPTLERRGQEPNCTIELSRCDTIGGDVTVPASAVEEDCGDEIPNKFIAVKDILDNATAICMDFQGMAGDLHKDGLARTIVKKVKNGVNKKGVLFEKGVDVTVSYLLKINPQVALGAEAVDQVTKSIWYLCAETIKRLGTSDKGCAKQIKAHPNILKLLEWKKIMAARVGELPFLLNGKEIGTIGFDFNPTK